MNENDVVLSNNVISSLPEMPAATSLQLQNLIATFNLPRSILASSTEIQYAWSELPREINRIPPQLRNELMVRMCVAISVGLFDGAINYAWNAVISNLRNKIKYLGLNIVGQVLNKNFEESNLNELMDSELIDLCYKLELLSEEGYFFLNQCRDIRNNFSVAHPSIAQIDDRELINFISRCCKYGLNDDFLFRGINIPSLLDSIKTCKLDDAQIEAWIEKLRNTFPAQRQLLFPTLLGIYCDSTSNEIVRINALKLSLGTKELLDEKTISSLVDQHNKYFLHGESDKSIASSQFFEKLGLLNVLSEAEQHSIIKKACQNLYNSHMEYNNFYNEPPFAERLTELSDTIIIPNTIKYEYVYTVLLCYVGNQYGISNSALSFYEKMIKNFSPREIGMMLGLFEEQSTVLSNRIRAFAKCKNRFILAIRLIDKESIAPSQQALYEKILKGIF